MSRDARTGRIREQMKVMSHRDVPIGACRGRHPRLWRVGAFHRGFCVDGIARAATETVLEDTVGISALRQAAGEEVVGNGSTGNSVVVMNEYAIGT